MGFFTCLRFDVRFYYTSSRLLLLCEIEFGLILTYVLQSAAALLPVIITTFHSRNLFVEMGRFTT